jgi:nucleoside-diphosphate-sugar epimerase
MPLKSLKKALVTGGCGFIGSRLVNQLVRDGFEVVVVDDMSVGDISALTEHKLLIRTVPAALLNQFLVQDAMKQAGTLVIAADFVDPIVLHHLQTGEFTHVFHLAANPRVSLSVEKPATTTETNLMKTVELLSACRDIGLEKFIFASSSAVYGDNHQLYGEPTTENDTPAPESPYGLQKLACEMFMKQFSQLYGLNTIALRFFNVYGPGAADGSAYMTAITAWCAALSKGEPLRSDGDGDQTRDMIYVDDVVDAMLDMAVWYSEPGFVVANVATGNSTSNNMILEWLKIRFPSLTIQHAPERAGDVKHTLASILRIRELVGWQANTPIDKGLEKTLSWWNLKIGK